MNLDTIHEYIRSRDHELDPEWRAFRIDILPPPLEDIAYIRGAVAPFKRHKPTERNWRARDRSTEFTAVICIDDYNAWAAKQKES